MTDREIIILVLNNDKAALQELVERVEEPIRYAVFSILGPRRPAHDHDEVVQETYLALLGALKRMQSDSLSAFAYGIAKRQAKQWLSKQSRQYELSKNEVAGQRTHSQKQPSPEEQVSSANRLKVFHETLTSRLTVREAQVYELHFLKRLTIQEVSLKLDISPENTRQIRHNLRKKAKDIFDD